jgi:hypothetical protein
MQFPWFILPWCYISTALKHHLSVPETNNPEQTLFWTAHFTIAGHVVGSLKELREGCVCAMTKLSWYIAWSYKNCLCWLFMPCLHFCFWQGYYCIIWSIIIIIVHSFCYAGTPGLTEPVQGMGSGGSQGYRDEYKASQAHGQQGTSSYSGSTLLSVSSSSISRARGYTPVFPLLLYTFLCLYM